MQSASKLVVAVLVAVVAAALPTTAAGAEDQPIMGATEPPTAELEYHTTTIGPIELDAMGSPGFEDVFFGAIDGPDVDIAGLSYYAVRTASFDLVDGAGMPVPREDVHLHHMLLVQPGTYDHACPGRPAQFTIASGMERTPIAIPEGYAWKIDDAQSWASNWHFMNRTDAPKTVYAEFTFGVQPDATDANTRWVEPWFLDIDGCGDAEFDVPGDGEPGETWTKSRTWDVPDGGVVVGTAGHVHQGGIATELRDGEGDLLCRSDGTYVPGTGHVGHGAEAAETSAAVGIHDGMRLDAMSTCPLHWRLEPGEDLTVTGIYDASVPQHGQMGIMVTFIWEGDQTAGLVGFPDVSASHPFHLPILWAADRGISTGFGDGTYRPTEHVSRQGVLAFLYRLAAPTDGPWAPAPFSDVAPGSPFATPLAWAAANGLATAYPDGTFRPGWCVRRGDVVALAFGLEGAPSGPWPAPGFTDVPPGHPQYAAVAWAAANGIATGYLDGTFHPERCLTRQAAMATLYRLATYQTLEDMRAQYDEFVMHVKHPHHMT